jgi:hypothetical protein
LHPRNKSLIQREQNLAPAKQIMTTQGEQKYCFRGTNRDYNGNKNLAPMEQITTTQGEQKYCVHGTNRDYNGNKNLAPAK